MNAMITARTKSLLALGGTLLLGMVLGGLLVSAIAKKRATMLALVMVNEQRFVQRLEEIVQPSEAQQDTVRQILHKHGSVITSRSQEFRRAQWESFDSLKHALQPVLTAEQYAHVLKAAERIDMQKNRQNRRKE